MDMFDDHRFERLASSYENGQMTVQEYGERYAYLLEVVSAKYRTDDTSFK